MIPPRLREPMRFTRGGRGLHHHRDLRSQRRWLPGPLRRSVVARAADRAEVARALILVSPLRSEA